MERGRSPETEKAERERSASSGAGGRYTTGTAVFEVTPHTTTSATWLLWRRARGRGNWVDPPGSGDEPGSLQRPSLVRPASAIGRTSPSTVGAAQLTLGGWPLPGRPSLPSRYCPPFPADQEQAPCRADGLRLYCVLHTACAASGTESGSRVSGRDLRRDEASACRRVRGSGRRPAFPLSQPTRVTCSIDTQCSKLSQGPFLLTAR